MRTSAKASVMKESDTAFIMKGYSVVLIKKLEEKNEELEQTIAELRRAHERILELNSDLENRVKERTAELETPTGNCPTPFLK